MALKVFKTRQLSFSLPNKVGLLFGASEAIAAAKINIEAFCAYEMEDEAYFMLITDDPQKTKRVVQKMGAQVESDGVLCIEAPNKIGQLQAIAKKIADAGIDIYFAYTSPGKGRTATLIFKTANDGKVIKALS